MHPAISVIFFTTMSGAGFGLLFWLGLYGAAGLLPFDAIFAAVAMIVALGTAAIGLVSSMFHLGHPERAWRAFSQWRTSWLSREGVAAVGSYVPAIIFGAWWTFKANSGALLMASGLVSAAGAVVTVMCTAYIYRSLKPVPRWHNGWVVPNYLALSAMSGALLMVALSKIFGRPLWGIEAVALAAIAIALLCKLAYWRFIDNAKAISTPETATGLGALGKVSLLEAPHTSENYLLKEMGFRTARKHARKLRMIAVLFGFVLPFGLIAIALFSMPLLAALCALLAVAAACAGLLVERWLFFAEAKHSVTLYYGRHLDAVA